VACPSLHPLSLAETHPYLVHPVHPDSLLCFFGIGLATTLTFLAMFRSWLTDFSQLGQIIHRIFPLARGIFEDKVSNVWCFLSVLPLPAHYKLRNIISGPALAKLSLLTTVLVISLPCMQLFAAAAETVRIEIFLDQDIQHQLVASEKRKVEGSVAGSTKSKRRRKASHVAPSETGSDLASILSGTRGGGGGGSTIRGSAIESKLNGHATTEKPMAVASSSPSPASSVLPYALLSTSLAFFLFGFQTHEKSILLPLLPITLLLTAKGDEYGGGAGKTDWEWAVLTNNLAVFSMWPLLQRDGLSLQYVLLGLLWNWSIGYQPFSGLKNHRQTFVAWFGAFAHLAILGLHLLEVLFPLFPLHTRIITSKYPDLFAVLNVLLCTPSFVLIWLWSIKRQLEVGIACGIDIFSLQTRGSLAKSKAKVNKKL
jgi:alpha-1,3-glucosyltransferase